VLTPALLLHNRVRDDRREWVEACVVLIDAFTAGGASEVTRTIGVAGGNRRRAVSHCPTMTPCSLSNGGTKVWNLNPATESDRRKLDRVGIRPDLPVCAGGRFAVLGTAKGYQAGRSTSRVSATVVERVDAPRSRSAYLLLFSSCHVRSRVIQKLWQTFGHSHPWLQGRQAGLDRPQVCDCRGTVDATLSAYLR
jgi:hypothetical protein